VYVVKHSNAISSIMHDDSKPFSSLRVKTRFKLLNCCAILYNYRMFDVDMTSLCRMKLINAVSVKDIAYLRRRIRDDKDSEMDTRVSNNNAYQLF